MSSKYARGKISISACDRCGMEFLLRTLRPLTIKTKITNILVCPTCWEPDQPQLQIGMYPISDPQALRNPRRDTSYDVSGLAPAANTSGYPQKDIKTTGVKTRGNGAAIKGLIARGPMA